MQVGAQAAAREPGGGCADPQGRQGQALGRDPLGHLPSFPRGEWQNFGTQQVHDSTSPVVVVTFVPFGLVLWQIDGKTDKILQFILQKGCWLSKLTSKNSRVQYHSLAFEAWAL